MIESEAASLLRKTQILFVDDEEFVVKSMKLTLGRVFGEVYTALNGREGLELFQKHLPDLVITDITMPGMDGFEMIEQIRKVQPNVKLIVISGHNGIHHVERSRQLGAIHITKPIEKEDLVRAIEKVLDVDLSFTRK